MSKSLKRLDKLLLELGYCKRRTFQDFLKFNDVQIGGQDVYRLKKGTMVDWYYVTVNGKPLEFAHSLNLAMNKPVGMRSTSAPDYAIKYRDPSGKNFYREVERLPEEEETEEVATEAEAQEDGNEEEDDGEIFDIFPELFVFRSPELRIVYPLPDNVAGLTVLTQDELFFKYLHSVRTPLKRVYEVRVRYGYTGLEDEAVKLFRGEIKGSVKRYIPAPKFNIVDEDENIAHIVLYDYKPDKVLDMLVSMRHEPLSIRRIGLGNLIIATEYTRKLYEHMKKVDPDNAPALLELGDADWCELDANDLAKLREPYSDIVAARRYERNDYRESHRVDVPMISPKEVLKNFDRVEKLGLDKAYPTKLHRLSKRKPILEPLDRFSEHLLGALDPKKNYEISQVGSRRMIDSIFEEERASREGRTPEDVGNNRQRFEDKFESNLSAIGQKLRQITDIKSKDKYRGRREKVE